MTSTVDLAVKSDAPAEPARVGRRARLPDLRRWVSPVALIGLWAGSAWAKAWAEETGLPLEVARAAVAAGPDLPVPLDDRVVASEQRLADAFTDDGVLPGQVDFAAFVDRRFVNDIEG